MAVISLNILEQDAQSWLGLVILHMSKSQLAQIGNRTIT